VSTEAPTKAPFALRGHNPDVLTCIANLSNDEVFTPPELANQMLDTLADAWAEANDGASIWADATVTFLDPFTKSGVFLREIVARLVDGLAEQMPDLQVRVDHILTKQVFGIGITSLTALLARRSVYCSKDATGEHSIAKSFDRDWGNIWFERTEHTWAGARCVYCPAQRERFDRADALESHAYAFIHTSDIRVRLARMFGVDMQFDVIVGNPPYQMAGGAGGSSDSSIYQLFVDQAIKLEPRLLSMVIPSRWMAGGRGMDEFRSSMLSSKRLSRLVDFPVSKDVFPGVEVKGGVCYFMLSNELSSTCEVTVFREGIPSVDQRQLDEFDIFVRDPKAAEILRLVLAAGDESLTVALARDTPFGLATNFQAFRTSREKGDVPLYLTKQGRRDVGYVARASIVKNAHLIDKWKVLLPKAGSDGGQRIPDMVLGKPWLAPAPSVCTQSFIFIYVDSPQQAASALSYSSTRFFRFLVSLRKITQDALFSTYSWVPLQTWDREWTDQELYAKYGLTDGQIGYIESRIKSMELSDA